MERRVEQFGLSIAPELALFVEARALPRTGVKAKDFWKGFSAIVHDLAPKNRALLETREAMQQQIDAWHMARRGQPQDAADYRAFLEEIGYLLPEGEDFTIETGSVDPEIAETPGPQLVVPITNARYALNAANARWGSLYDALYGTDALGSAPPAGGYDRARGREVIAWGRRFLDEAVPLAGGSHFDVAAYRVENGALVPELADPGQFIGWRGTEDAPEAVVLRNNGLHLIIEVDASTPVGQDDRAGVSDIKLESALSAIMDCEDSVACVDAADKVAAYDNWQDLHPQAGG